MADGGSKRGQGEKGRGRDRDEGGGLWETMSVLDRNPTPVTSLRTLFVSLEPVGLLIDKETLVPEGEERRSGGGRWGRGRPVHKGLWDRCSEVITITLQACTRTCQYLTGHTLSHSHKHT